MMAARGVRTMQGKGWVGILGLVLTLGLLSSASLRAAPGDGYSIEDLGLDTASELVDVCTLEAGHDDYEVAIAFCYGFFEGAANYDDSLAGPKWHRGILCEPPEVTRGQAVSVFIEYINANPQYGSELPVDAIFRALVDKWPCTD
jgi:hypothetical protein